MEAKPAMLKSAKSAPAKPRPNPQKGGLRKGEGIVEYYTREETVERNLKVLRGLDPVKVTREWCEIDRKRAAFRASICDFTYE